MGECQKLKVKVSRFTRSERRERPVDKEGETNVWVFAEFCTQGEKWGKMSKITGVTTHVATAFICCFYTPFVLSFANLSPTPLFVFPSVYPPYFRQSLTNPHFCLSSFPSVYPPTPLPPTAAAIQHPQARRDVLEGAHPRPVRGVLRRPQAVLRSIRGVLGTPHGLKTPTWARRTGQSSWSFFLSLFSSFFFFVAMDGVSDHAHACMYDVSFAAERCRCQQQ